MMQPQDFARLANNFYNYKGLESQVERINLDIELSNFISQNQKLVEKKYKVAFVFICLNPLYWEYAPAMVEGAKNFFLPGHKTDFFFWTDIPEDTLTLNRSIFGAFQGALLQKGIQNMDGNHFNRIQEITDQVVALRKRDDVHIIPTPAMDWPHPTLMRYHLFLQQEEKLKDYDYIFYLDIDMQFCQIVGDMILPQEGLMACQHPMYALRKELYPPYEPNPESSAYIPRPGRVINDGGKPRFQPLYYAGGFQGGKSDKFIEAMKVMRKMVDDDRAKNYIPIWNDESIFNAFLFKNPPEVVLDPSFIYPDSLIKEYYIPYVWGRDFQPIIKTLTKWFSTSKEGGQAVQQLIKK